MKFQPSSAPALMACLALSVAAPAFAQSKTAPQPQEADPVAEALRNRGEAYRRAPDSAQTPEELRTTSALNAEIMDQNDLAEMEERARLSDYAKAQAEYQAELERVEAERLRIALEADEQEARYKAERDAHARARADWEACVAGDRTRCTTPR